MKRILSVLLIVVLLIGLMPTVAFAANTTEFAGGSGTASDPYLISTKTHLNNVRNYLSAHFKMTSDIEFTDADFAEGGDFYNDGKGFAPIGRVSSTAFKGVFDGNGYTIKNLHINLTAANVGLFGRNSGTIKNLGLADSEISYSALTQSYSSANHYVGSIAGTNDGIITNCYNTGTVSASATSISGCFAGGIVGGDAQGTIENCYNTGNVSVFVGDGNAYAGGIEGTNNGVIINCYNTGNISAKSSDGSSTAGGITAGNSIRGTIENCYNIGTVSISSSSSSYTGGIVGNNRNTVTNCYYADIISQGVGNGTDATIKCTADELKQQSTFVGFDFENVWTMTDNKCYPYLVLKGIEFALDHMYDNACDTTCNCGYVREVTHDYKAKFDTENHFEKCSVCSEVINVKAHEFDNACDTACSCGYTREITHNYQLAFDSNFHFDKCSICGDIINITPHIAGSLIVDTVSTCSATGIGHKNCTVCGQVAESNIVIAINPTAHKWETEYTVDIPETCGVAGSKSIYCEYCDTKKAGSDAVIPATGKHIAGELITDIAATCVATGMGHKNCTVCGLLAESNVIIDIDLTTHKYAATFDNDNHFDKCSVCDDVINVKAHEFDNACDTACPCGYTREITHNYQPSFNSEKHYKECTVCKDKINVTSHSFENDCDTTCNCGYVREITHDYKAKFDTENHFDKCSVCGDVINIKVHEFDNACDTACPCGYTRTIKHDHKATFDTNNHFDKCTVCGDVINVKVHAFENACDTTCDCGYTRTITHEHQPTFDKDNHFDKCIICGDVINSKAHNFDNACDTTCPCGYVRAITHDHQPSFNAEKHYKECTVCGDRINITAHSFENDCDTTCNCGYVREITHDYKAKFDTNNHFDKCSVCGDVINVKAHEFDNACDTACPCGYTRTITHDHQPTFDKETHFDKCIVCGDVINVKVHEFENTCDTTCDCGFIRAITHDHQPTFDNNNHFDKCTVCGDVINVKAHEFENNCDTTCDCGYERTITHSYGKYIYNNDATAKKDGTKTRTCKVCGDKQTITATGTKWTNPFTDVKKSDFYYEPVLWAVNNGITSGTSKTTFSPNEACTRGQIATFLWRAAGQPTPKTSKNPFKDVKKSDYYYKAVLWAVGKGVTSGTSKTTFSPNDPCTRGQIATFLWRANGGKKVNASNPFTDVKKSDYYYNAVLWAVKNGITAGTSKTTFEPNAPCTRGQIATFLYRAYN